MSAAVEDMVRRHTYAEMAAILAGLMYQRDVLKEQGKYSEGLTLAIEDIERQIGKLPPNARWIITTGSHSPKQYQGRVFIYDSYEKALEDNDALVGEITMAEYVGDSK